MRSYGRLRRCPEEKSGNIVKHFLKEKQPLREKSTTYSFRGGDIPQLIIMVGRYTHPQLTSTISSAVNHNNCLE